MAMIDRTHIGRTLSPHSANVEGGRLRLFAKAVGETRPEYTDEAAALAAGHPALPALPTYVLCLDFDKADPYAWFAEFGIDIARVLHGSQSFRYFAPIYAGDRLAFVSRIEDVFQKRCGALNFVIKETDVTNQHGVRVAELRATIVIRGDQGGQE
jgi:acyl dehydratase